jgi:hypothetical protein
LQCDAEGDPARESQAVELHHEPEQREHADRGRQGRLGTPAGIGFDRTLHAELRHPVRVHHPPVRAGTAFVVDLPGLVDRFHDEVVQVARLGSNQEFPQELGLVSRGRIGPHPPVALAGPTDLTDDDLLVREFLFDLTQAVKRIVERVVDRQAFPVRQKVDGDEVDIGRKLGVTEPDVPRLSRGHRLAGAPLDLTDLQDEIGRRECAMQYLFVPDDDPFDAAVDAHRLLERLDLFLIVVFARVEPDAGGDVELILLSKGWQDRQFCRAVGPDPGGLLGENAHVASDRVVLRILLLQRRVPAPEGVVGQAGHLSVEGRCEDGGMRLVPGDEVAHGHAGGQRNRAEQRPEPAARKGAGGGWGCRPGLRKGGGGGLGYGLVVTISVHGVPASAISQGSD